MDDEARAGAAYVAGYDQRHAAAVDALRGATAFVLVVSDGSENVGVDAAFLSTTPTETAGFLATASEGVAQVWRLFTADLVEQHSEGE